MTKGIPVCIDCGGPVNALNEDEDGDPCPTCAERLIETLPGVFHAPWGHESASEAGSGVSIDADAEMAHADDDSVGGSSPHSPGPRSSRGRGTPGSGQGDDSFGEPRGSA